MARLLLGLIIRGVAAAIIAVVLVHIVFVLVNISGHIVPVIVGATAGLIGIVVTRMWRL